MIFTDRDQRFETLLLSESIAIAITNSGGIIDVSKTTQRWLRGSVNQLIKFTGNCRIDQLTPQQIESWHLQTTKATTAVTANNYLRAINIIYNRLLNHGLIAQNPASYVPYTPEPPRSPRAIEKPTYLKLRKAAQHKRDIAIIDTLWATGCRLGELLSIQIESCEFWEDSNGRCCALYVTGKFGKGRHVYASKEQAKSIYQYHQQRPQTKHHDQLFITFNGSPLTNNGVYSLLKRLRKDGDITTRCNPHSFRHAFAIRKLNEGYDLPTVSAWLGHTDPAFTARVYMNQTEADLRRKYFE